MTNIAIRCEGLSKRYRIGKRERYKALRDVLTDSLSAPFRLVAQRAKRKEPSAGPSPLALSPAPTSFWALDDVSFSVKHGEVVGIIGRNGAGKSTLLKILSRITEPTRGYAEINGRVGSLLEVGTGFHPELTGRENIYLNGAILGMKRAEIERRFDEIVTFAETEKFLDTPVKYYSSGMQMRLAFAVAAHLDPEILLVDEVLAVGDTQFQKKCLGKIGEVAREGRTVLFVSHQMAAVENLCSAAILLDFGHLIMKADCDSIVQLYLKQSNSVQVQSLVDRRDRTGTGDIRFTSVELLNRGGSKLDFFGCGDYAVLRFYFDYGKNVAVKNIELDIGVDNEFGARILWLSTRLTGEKIECTSKGLNRIDLHIPELPLMPGQYTFTIHATVDGIVADWIKQASQFNVEARDYFGNGRLPQQGTFLVRHHFAIPETP